MKKTRKAAKPGPAGTIARLPDQGKSISHFFKGGGRMVRPVQRLNVDLTAGMLAELDTADEDLNVCKASRHQNAGSAGAGPALHGATRVPALTRLNC